MATTFMSLPMQAALENIDKPLPPSPLPSNLGGLAPALPLFETSLIFSIPTVSSPSFTSPAPPSKTPASLPKRISKLPPVQCNPDGGAHRYMFIAVRSGRSPGVYTDWQEAERQLVDYPEPVFKTFSTRLAAEAFINGWDGAGRHSVPGSCPKPLREHLAMNFPSSIPLSSSSRRPSYHSRLVSALPGLPALPEAAEISQLSLDRDRTGLYSMSFARSQVRISSPLRQQVDDNDDVRRTQVKKPNFVFGAGGLFSPPLSPVDGEKLPLPVSVMDRQRPTQRKGTSEAGLWASVNHREFGAGGSTPNLRRTLTGNSSVTSLSRSTSGGLWADAKPPVPSPLAVTPSSENAEPSLAAGPKFSRAGVKKSGVVMPVAAPRSTSSSSLKSRLSRSPSTTSLNSLASASTYSLSLKNLRRPPNVATTSADRLATLTESSMHELQHSDRGQLDTFTSLTPPRPAFMRRTPSSSSTASSSDSVHSSESMASLTSASSAVSSAMQTTPSPSEHEHEHEHEHGPAIEYGPQAGIPDEEPPQLISCTKSEGDAESESQKSGGGKKNKKGGLFKRLSMAFKSDKKVIPGSQEIGRRGSQ